MTKDFAEYLAEEHAAGLDGDPPPNPCCVGGCHKPAIWRRKPGWGVAPYSPPGDVCEEHHCWERIR